MELLKARLWRRLLPAGLGALVAATLLAACGGEDPTGSGDLAASGGADQPPAGAEAEFSTDFSTHSVPLDEFLSGGPPKDGIPAIDDPKLVSISEADEFLSATEPVAVLEVDGEARAYPIQILVWHEIVNDSLAGEPVAVTYCPLCNSTVAFSREVDGRVLDFGTTGRLRKSDLVMYDRQTESWWQQLTAEAVVGELTGAGLEVLPSQILPWEEVKRTYRDAEVLSRDTGFDRDYGANPYTGYDDPDSEPFALQEDADDRLPPKELVTAVKLEDGKAVVYPRSVLVEEAPVNDRIDGRPVVVMFEPEVASALDAGAISEGREVGAGAVFERTLDGETLTFESGPDPGTARDRATGSTWDATGRAIEGRLKGERLAQIPSDNQFWFAVAAFFKGAEIRGEGEASP
ncbi:MAG: DUF3179 domain-containing protein [Solirubrobacterales bacterium]